MKRCHICFHRIHIPGKCIGEMSHGAACPCKGPMSTEVPLELAREILARKARGRAAKRAGDFWEQEVIAKAKAEGWLVHHVRPAKTAKGWRSPISGHKGFPDVALAHTRGKFLLVECKSGTGTLSAEQKEWHRTLSLSGCDVSVWRPEDRDAIWRQLQG